VKIKHKLLVSSGDKGKTEEGGQVLQSYIREGKRERLKAKGSNSNVQLLIEKYV